MNVELTKFERVETRAVVIHSELSVSNVVGIQICSTGHSVTDEVSLVQCVGSDIGYQDEKSMR